MCTLGDRMTLLFRMMNDDACNAVIGAMSPMTVEPGHLLIEEGSHGNRYFVMESGRAHIYVRTEEDCELNPEGNPLGVQIENRICPGMGFGELSLLYSSPRSASVQAATHCKLWVMERLHYSQIKRRYSQKVPCPTLHCTLLLFPPPWLRVRVPCGGRFIGICGYTPRPSRD